MKKQKFVQDATYLPVTMSQFEELTNELLAPINELCRPNFLSGDYFAQILMSAIHAYPHKQGLVFKSELFESCVNRISCHATFHAVEEIKKRLSPAKADAPEANDPETDNPQPIEAETPAQTQAQASQS